MFDYFFKIYGTRLNGLLQTVIVHILELSEYSFYHILKLIAINQRVNKGVWPGFTGKWVVHGLMVSEMKGLGPTIVDQQFSAIRSSWQYYKRQVLECLFFIFLYC